MTQVTSEQGIVDIHPHILSDDFQRYPFTPVGGEVSAWARKRPVTAEQLIGAMDRTGISQAVVVQASTAYGYDNSYVAHAADTYPSRLAAVACVNPLSASAPEDIRRWVTGRGAVGLRLFAAGSTIGDESDWLDSPATFPAWETAGSLGVPVCVQTRFRALPKLIAMLERFPQVRVVLDHLAYPDLSSGPEHSAAAPLLGLAGHPNLFLKLTMRNLEPLALAAGGPAPFLRILIDAFGADRIAWGSNFPAADASLDSLLQLVLTSVEGLSAAERDWILGGTARLLYPALGRAQSPNSATSRGAR